MSRRARVGAHREQVRTPLAGWKKFLIAVALGLVTAALIVLGLELTNPGMGRFSPPVPSNEVVAISDPAEAPDDTTVAVLDATRAGDLAYPVAARVEKLGWRPGEAGQATSPYEESIIFYSAPEYAAAADLLARQLGVQSTALTTVEFSESPVTLVVGEDAESIGLRP